jgi:NADH dehydrogenase
MPPHPTRTVILGCSFAALEFLYRTSRRLGRFAPGEVTVVEPLGSHAYIPLMHEVVSGARSAERLQFDTARFCRAIGATLVHRTAASVDPVRRVVRLSDAAEVAYDRLIVTIGSVPDLDPAIGPTENVYTAKFLDSARQLRARLLALAAQGDSPIRVAVIGAGITGVEWSAELAGRGLPGARVVVTLIGRESRILPEFSPNVARHAARRLDQLGVHTLVGRETTTVRAGAVRVRGGDMGDGEVECDIVVWAAGVRPSAVASSLGLPLTAAGRVVVTPRLDVPGFPGVFAAGDAASIVEDGHTWPTAVRAIEAIWQGAYLARRLQSDASIEVAPRYRFHRTFFFGLSLGPSHSLIVYRRWWLGARFFVGFRRWLQWAYYARFHLLAGWRMASEASR